jgi:hypothetical protein
MPLFRLPHHYRKIIGLHPDDCSFLSGKEVVGQLLKGVQMVHVAESLVYIGGKVLWISKPLLSVTSTPSRARSYLC